MHTLELATDACLDMNGIWTHHSDLFGPFLHPLSYAQRGELIRVLVRAANLSADLHDPDYQRGFNDGLSFAVSLLDASRDTGV